MNPQNRVAVFQYIPLFQPPTSYTILWSDPLHCPVHTLHLLLLERSSLTEAFRSCPSERGRCRLSLFFCSSVCQILLQPWACSFGRQRKVFVHTHCHCCQ